MEENRADNQTPRKQHSSRPKKKKTGMVWKVLGTLFAIGLVTGLMFFGIFMVYVNTTLEPELDVDISAYTLKQSSTVYYQDKTSGEWVELPVSLSKMARAVLFQSTPPCSKKRSSSIDTSASQT